MISVHAAGVVTRHNLFEEFETDYDADLLGVTIMTVKGRIAVNQGVGAVVGDSVRLGCVIEPANRLLSQSTDGPFNQPHIDWFLWEPMCFTDAGGTPQERMINVQSARKVSDLGEEPHLYIAAEAGNSGSLQVSVDLSIGFKLP